MCAVDLTQRSGKFKYIVLLGRAAAVKSRRERGQFGSWGCRESAASLPPPMFLSSTSPSVSVSLLVTSWMDGCLTARLYCFCLHADGELQLLLWDIGPALPAPGAQAGVSVPWAE